MNAIYKLWFAKGRQTRPAQSQSDRQIKRLQGTWIGAISTAALLSFTWIPNSYVRMVSWPYCLWWQIALLGFVGWGIWIARQFDRPLHLLGFRLDTIVLLIAISNGLATLNAEFPLVAPSNFLLLCSYGVVLYVLANWLRQSPSLQAHLWFGLVLTGTITHAISLALWRPTTDMWSSHNFYAAIRNPLPLGHHNFVGGYCLLLLPITVGFVLCQHGWRRWIGYGAIALNALALYASGSRGALIGFLALLLIALPLYLILQTHRTKKHWIIGLLLSLLTIGLLFSNPRIRSLATFNPGSNATAFSIEQIADGPGKDRLIMLQAGQRIFQTHPLLGIGPGNLSRVYNLYRPSQAGSGLELVQQLHNTPAQILTESGILGFSAYLLWIGWLLKLGITLYKKELTLPDRILLYSIGASWFGYSVSSLSDYQLENVGIASTLVITSALLIHLVHTYTLSFAPAPTDAPSPDMFSRGMLSKRTRRLFSLGLMLFASVWLQTWARIDVGFYLANAAQQDIESYNLADADRKWLAASQLVPWDPTYAALSAEQLISAIATVEDSEQQKTLSEAAIASLHTTLRAAPNDAWFNQNLAVLLLPTGPAEAEEFARKAALLAPRSQHYTYYTLGLSYLRQGKRDQATTAFILEAIANPQFLTDPLWKTSDLSGFLPAVTDRTLTAWQQILSSTAPNSAQYAWLYQQIAIAQWWNQQPTSVDFTVLSPFIQVVFHTDDNPAQALTLLEPIAHNNPKVALLQAWLSPDQYLTPLLNSSEITPEETQTLTENIQTHRNLRHWLTSITQPITLPQRYGLTFAYRNSAANNIHTILIAPGPTTTPLTNQLNLFPPPPREFAQLDQKLVEIASQSLSPTSPT